MNSDDVMHWVHDFPKSQRPAAIVVAREDKQSTYFLFGQNKELSAEKWVLDGVTENLISRTREIPLRNPPKLPIWFPPERGSWELLWGLISGRDFIVDEPLRTLVDHGSFIAFEFYRLLWEARFLTTENVNLRRAQEVVHTITKWMSGHELSVEESEWFKSLNLGGPRLAAAQRYDILCMFFTLLRHNDLIQHHVFSFTGLERALPNPELLQDLELFLSSVDRWIRMGSCPIGVLIGFDATAENMEQLRDNAPKLAHRVEVSLEWVEETCTTST